MSEAARERGLPSEPSARSPAPRPVGRAGEATRKGGSVSTMRDVARLAGVSAKTVSRVMNNDRYVSDDVRTRVLQAVEELQYVPNVMARSFRSGQDSAIGVAVPAVTGYFGHVVEAVEATARDRGVAMYLTCLGQDPTAEQAAVEALLARNIVGLLIAPTADDQSYLRPWRDAHQHGLHRPPPPQTQRRLRRRTTTTAAPAWPSPTCSNTATAASPSPATASPSPPPPAAAPPTNSPCSTAASAWTPS